MPATYPADSPEHDEAPTAAGDCQRRQHRFEKLYRSTSSRLFGVCLRIIPQRAEAEDVLQEVFTNVWRKATQFDPARASGLTWMTMMARNRAIDHIRSGRASRQSVSIELAEDLVDGSPDAQGAAEAMLEGHRLDVCLGELEAPRRQLVRTAFFEGSTRGARRAQRYPARHGEKRTGAACSS